MLWAVKYEMEDEGSSSEELVSCASLRARLRVPTPRAGAGRTALASSTLVPPSASTGVRYRPTDRRPTDRRARLRDDEPTDRPTYRPTDRCAQPRDR